MRESRLDFLPLSLGATPIEVRPEGWRVYEGTAAFGDVVHPYPDLTPPRAEFRPASEALADATLASAEGVPVTYDHPDPASTPAGLLVADTTRAHQEGAVIRAWREGDKFRVRIIAYSPDLQQCIEDGAVELSLGYTLDTAPQEGVHQGQPYQAVQKNLRINHLAVVPAGKHARSTRPDGAIARLDILAQKTPVYPQTVRPPMTTRTDAAALSPDAMAMLKQMPAADQDILMGLLEVPAVEADAAEATEVADDAAQDQAMIAPLEARIAKLEAMIAKKDEMPATKPARKDVAPSIDVAAILAQAKAAAVEQVEANASFVQAVRLDGHNVGTVTEAGAHMLATVKDHLPELHEQAIDALKQSRMDSLTALYRSAERVRRDRAAEARFGSVLSATAMDPLPSISDESLFPA